MDLNESVQFYKGISLMQINRNSYNNQKARRFTLNHTNQNVWIPCKHLEEDGTIKPDENIDYVFFRAKRQCELAGIEIMFKVAEGVRQ